MSTSIHCSFTHSINSKLEASPSVVLKQRNLAISTRTMDTLFFPLWIGTDIRRSKIRAQSMENVEHKDSKKLQTEEFGDADEYPHDSSSSKVNMDDPYLMDPEERQEWRRKIREVMSKYPDLEEELDQDKKKEKMQKLMAEYPLVVEEDNPDWPDDADGWGFSLDQFFNKITINNVKKDDDENYDSENEVTWQDDNYIRPIKDITTAEWEETVFKDISPLIVLVHNRYKRPKENERVRSELDKAVHIIWNCRLPSPRCVAIDAVTEIDLVSALKVSGFPETIFTKAGKILYRERANRTADELSKIMAFFYYGAARPPYLTSTAICDELIPSVTLNSESAAAEGVVIMEPEGIEVPKVGAFEFAVGYTRAFSYRIEDFKDLNVPCPAIVQEYVDRAVEVLCIGKKNILCSEEVDTKSINTLIPLFDIGPDSRKKCLIPLWDAIKPSLNPRRQSNLSMASLCQGNRVMGNEGTDMGISSPPNPTYNVL